MEPQFQSDPSAFHVSVSLYGTTGLLHCGLKGAHGSALCLGFIALFYFVSHREEQNSSMVPLKLCNLRFGKYSVFHYSCP